MNDKIKLLRRNVIGNQKFSILMMRRALMRAYYVKEWQIDYQS